jgi:hypothetical protein
LGLVLALLVGTLGVRADNIWSDVAMYRLGENASRVEAAFTLVDGAFGEEACREMETALLAALAAAGSHRRWESTDRPYVGTGGQ